VKHAEPRGAAEGQFTPVTPTAVAAGARDVTVVGSGAVWLGHSMARWGRTWAMWIQPCVREG